MSIKQKDLIIIRSFPWPQDEADIPRCINLFINSVYIQHTDTYARVAKAIRVARELQMQLPPYLTPLTEEGKQMAAELLDLQVNKDRAKEWEEYEKQLDDAGKDGVRLILFLDRVENLV